MKSSFQTTHRKAIVGILMAAFLGVSFAAVAMAAPRVYKMEGKITAIDPADGTVVINVPITKKNIFTVAGPLSDNAVLKIGKKKASLKDFKVGERVIVEWSYTPRGHLIRGLSLR